MFSHFLKPVVAASLTLSVCAGAAQAATAYTCKITKKSDHSMVPEVLFIGHPDGAKTAQVSDPVVYHFNDNKPVAAKVTRLNDAKATFKWRVKGPTTTSLKPVTIRYTADVDRKTGAIYVAARVTEFRGQLSGRGTCEIKKVKGSS